MLTETAGARSNLEGVSPAASAGVLDRLRDLCIDRGLEGLAERMGDLASLIGDDLAYIEAALQQVRSQTDLVERTADHLLDLGGKRVRPLCVALAARAGDGFGPRAAELAVAVELIHNATLLHDDVVDRAEDRRGAPSARVEFGNAAAPCL